MIGVSIDNGVMSLENDVMDIHRTIIVMRLIHESLHYNNYETKQPFLNDHEIVSLSLPPEGYFENINRRAVTGRS